MNSPRESFVGSMTFEEIYKNLKTPDHYFSEPKAKGFAVTIDDFKFWVESKIKNAYSQGFLDANICKKEKSNA